MALHTAGISTSLVASTIGAGSNDVGTLCTHSNVNMWSKRKPVRDYRSVVPFEEVGLADNCGLVLYPFTGDDTKITYYNKPGTWVDQFGQHTTPFRLGDFRGYEHNLKYRPVALRIKPSNIERKQTAISFGTVMEQAAPVVTLADFSPNMRVGVAVYGRNYTTDPEVYVGFGSTALQTDNYIVANLSSVDWLYLNLKFCLINGYVPWTTTMPTSFSMYELPRQYPNENPNWINVLLVTPPEDVKTFEIAGFVSQQEIRYVIQTYTTTTGRIDIVNSQGVVMQITNIQLPADTRVSATKTNMPLVSGVTYTAYLYLGASSTPVATRPMILA